MDANTKMTCYFRHLKEVFKKAEIAPTRDNKKIIDKTIHELVGVAYPNCPQTWKAIKRRLSENEESFISELGDAWNRAKAAKT